MNKKLLFVAALCTTMLFGGKAYAAYVDKTASVKTEATAWGVTGSYGSVTTADGREVPLPEDYQNGGVDKIGVILEQSLTELENGTYTVVLYANACFTSGRGWDSPMEDGATDVAYVYAGDQQTPIKAQIASDFSTSGEYTIENVVVTDGTLKIGLAKAKEGTNWHTIQIKSLSLYTEDSEIDIAKKALMEKIEEAKAIENPSQALTDAITAAQGVYDTVTEPAEADAAAATLQIAIITEKNLQSVADATAENPVLTDFVVNGTFDTEKAPWKSTTGAQNQALASNQQGAFTGKFFENWNPGNYTGKIYQTIENIPNGTYELSICAFASNFNGEHQFVYANTDKTYLTTGTPTAYKVYTTVTENKIEIGMEQDEAVNNWIGIDNVSLSYYGAETTINEAKMAGTKKIVNELLASEYVGTATKAILTSALDGLNAATTEEEVTAALEAANAAIVTANADTENGKAIAALKAFMASTNVYTQEAYETLAAKIAAYETAHNEGTLTESVPNPDKQMNWHAENFYDDFLLSVWGVKDYDSDLYINTWSGEGNTDGTDFRTPFFEYWTGDSDPLAAKTHTATIEGLQAGQLYELSALIRVQAQKNVTDAAQGITLQVGEGTPVDVTTGELTAGFNLGTFTAQGMSDEDGKLVVNFTIAEGNNVHWLSFKNLMYSLVPAPGVTTSELTEDGVYAIYHPEADKFLANNEAGDNAALRTLGKIEDLNAYKWNITIQKGEAEAKDTLTIQQVSSNLYFGAKGTNAWSMNLAEEFDATKSRFLITPADGTYTLSSLKNTSKMIGFNDLKESTSPYFDKGTGNKPYMQFVKAEDLDAYSTDKLYRVAKADLLSTIQKIKSLQDGELDGIHTAEEAAAFADTLAVAKELYKATIEELSLEALKIRILAFEGAIVDYMYATTADEENPADYTFYVVNPDMEDNTGNRVNEGGVTPGWEGTIETSDSQHNQHGTKEGIDTEYLSGKAIEIWRASSSTVDNRSIFQTIENLPNGKYTVSAAVFAADQNKEANENVGTMEWFANDQATAIDIYDFEAFTEEPDKQTEAGVFGAAKIYTAEVEVADGTLKFGVRDNQSHCNWFGFDNVTLTYFGEISEPVGKYEVIVKNAEFEENKGYKPVFVALDTTAIKEKLGIEYISDALLYILNEADKTLVENTTDGWRDSTGNMAQWGTSPLCIKCWPEDDVLEICTMQGLVSEGDIFSGSWAFVNGIDTVVVKTNVTIIADIIPDVTGPDECENVETYELKVYAQQDNNYKTQTAMLDIEDAAAKLGITTEEMANAFIFVTDENNKFIEGEANNGGAWFTAEGASTGWGNGSVFFVEPAAADFSTFVIGQFPEACEPAAIYNGTMYLVVGTKMVTLNFTLRIADPNGIDETLSDEDIVSIQYFTIDGAEIDAPAQSKYIERVTYSNGTVKSSIIIK